MFRALAQGIMPKNYCKTLVLGLLLQQIEPKKTRYTNLGEQTRNRANRDHILWAVQLKPGEFSRSYLLHMFSTLIQQVCGCLV